MCPEVKGSLKTEFWEGCWQRGEICARILPTRNGNGFVTSFVVSTAFCTDPTYKEWKLVSNTMYTFGARTHGSYLQGMETAARSVLAKIIDNLARILPTRNGNIFNGTSRLILPRNSARILPTRNGNRCIKPVSLTQLPGHGSYLQGMETFRAT